MDGEPSDDVALSELLTLPSLSSGVGCGGGAENGGPAGATQSVGSRSRCSSGAGDQQWERAAAAGLAGEGSGELGSDGGSGGDDGDWRGGATMRGRVREQAWEDPIESEPELPAEQAPGPRCCCMLRSLSGMEL